VILARGHEPRGPMALEDDRLPAWQPCGKPADVDRRSLHAGDPQGDSSRRTHFPNSRPALRRLTAAAPHARRMPARLARVGRVAGRKQSYGAGSLDRPSSPRPLCQSCPSPRWRHHAVACNALASASRRRKHSPWCRYPRSLDRQDAARLGMLPSGSTRPELRGKASVPGKRLAGSWHAEEGRHRRERPLNESTMARCAAIFRPASPNKRAKHG
jgi:hypothetical protein